MDKETVVLAVHVVVAIGLFAFGVYRISLGQAILGALNVAMGIAVVAVGAYVKQLA